MSIDRTKLLFALNLAKPALASQPYIPAFTHFLFNEDGVTAYNDIAAIRITLDHDLDSCLPGDMLLKTVSSMAGQSVLLQPLDDAPAVLVSSGRSRIKVPKLPVEDFPIKWPSTKSAESITLDQSILNGIRSCLVGVGTNPTHPAQMGVTLDVLGDKAVLYSTDNSTLSRFKTKTPIRLPGDSPVIMPTFFCEQVISLAKAFLDCEVTLFVLPGVLMARIGKAATIMTKTLVDLQPIDFAALIKKVTGSATDLSPIPAGWDDAMQRALLVLDGLPDKAAELSPRKGAIRLVARSERGEAEDTLDFDGEGPEEAIYIDPSLVLRGSKSASQLAFCSSAVMLVSGDGVYMHLIANCQQPKKEK